jgi:hypothetical protein
MTKPWSGLNRPGLVVPVAAGRLQHVPAIYHQSIPGAGRRAGYAAAKPRLIPRGDYRQNGVGGLTVQSGSAC